MSKLRSILKGAKKDKIKKRAHKHKLADDEDPRSKAAKIKETLDDLINDDKNDELSQSVNNEDDQSDSVVQIDDGSDDLNAFAKEEEDNSDDDVAAWHDSHDQSVTIDILKNNRTKKLQEEQDESTVTGVEYTKRLRKFQQKVAQNDQNELFKWAFDDKEDDGQEEHKDNLLMSLLSTNTKISSAQSYGLPKKALDFTRLSHVNAGEPHGSVVNATSFHPTNNLMLSGGLDKKLKLYNVNHTKSIRVQSIYCKDLPIYSASFIQSGKQIILSGARKHFYYYDLGKNELMKVSHIFGNHDEKDLKKLVTSPMSSYFAFLGRTDPKQVMVMSSQTKQLLFNLNISSGKLQDASFCGDYIYTVDTSGSIQQFDIRTRTAVTTIPDSGSYNSTCVNVSNTGKYLATGSYSGVVNIYDLQHSNILNEKQKPLKSIKNITTSINLVEFNHNDEILAIGSKWKKNGIKLVHTESLSVFENFPSFKNNVKYPFS